MVEPTQLIGKRVLVGITREYPSGEFSQEQYSGIAEIEHQDDFCLVALDCSDGERRTYPFDAQTLQPAAAGEYRLRSTGEVIVDPDYLMTWIVTEGSPEE